MAVDWNPSLYSAFRGLRLRPALDLLAQVGPLPAGDVVDLGCGDGAASGALRARFPDRRLVGVDASPAMLGRATGYDAKALADIATWQPDTPPALIFSNAALQWLGNHATLLPRLVALTAPGGTLAVQMPRNHFAPSHALLRAVAGRMFPDRFPDTPYVPPVAAPADYWRILSPLGQVMIWETEYLQELGLAAPAHPVRRFTESTAMRPFLDRLTPNDGAAFAAAYDAALHDAYPLLPGGGALFPFRRLFLILQRPA
jgi:trans-aconitate 2-methyltransferase